MSNLSITQRRSDSVVILDLQGKINIGEGSSKLRQTIRRLVEEGEKKILLNMAGVSSMDSTGLGELVSGLATLQRNGGNLRLLNLTERPSEIMTLTKLLTVFDTYNDEARAMESFGGGTNEASA